MRDRGVGLGVAVKQGPPMKIEFDHLARSWQSAFTCFLIYICAASSSSFGVNLPFHLSFSSLGVGSYLASVILFSLIVW